MTTFLFFFIFLCCCRGRAEVPDSNCKHAPRFVSHVLGGALPATFTAQDIEDREGECTYHYTTDIYIFLVKQTNRPLHIGFVKASLRKKNRRYQF